MGTRSLTYVYDDATPIICMYRQFDGYPSGHGVELSEFLNSFDEITNGYMLGETRKIANGMGCLAAQMIANFKQSVGGFYIHAVTDDNCGQDYEYHVYREHVIVKNYSGNVMFDGDWKSFHHFCESGDE